MDTAKQHLQANVLTWADNYSDIISMENKSLAGRTFLQMPAGWKMSVQLSERRLCKNFVINKYIQYDAQSTEVYPCIYVKVYMCVFGCCLCARVCVNSVQVSLSVCVCVWLCVRESMCDPLGAQHEKFVWHSFVCLFLLLSLQYLKTKKTLVNFTWIDLVNVLTTTKK